MRLVDATFAPKGFDEFTFRNAERQLDDREILTEEGDARRGGAQELRGDRAGRRLGTLDASKRW